MRVDEVMSTATCCKPENTIQECARVMRDENIGFVPICDEQRKPIGTLTDRDITIRVVADGKRGDERAQDCMTRDVVACQADDDVQRAEELMREHQVSRIIVCDGGGRLQGVISLQDLAHSESEELTGRTLTDVKSDQPSIH